MMSIPEDLPVAVVGAGPVGLAAAAQLMTRGLPVKVYEAGETIGANVRNWGHVRLFSPWGYNIDPAVKALLMRHGWREPCADTFPTGAELVNRYLAPLATTPDMAAVIETGARVTRITRHGADKALSRSRDARPFALSVAQADGRPRRDLARAVIDASGTWANPNPLGAGGVAAEGEEALGNQIVYGIPDVLGRDRDPYAGRIVAVIGAGHSAANVLLDLAELPGTSIIWITRGTGLMRTFGGGTSDQLRARGELGIALKAVVDAGRVTLVTGFAVTTVSAAEGAVILRGATDDGERTVGPADRIIVATGQRPDLSMTRELRLDLDPDAQSTPQRRHSQQP
jgi:cation diffusion facilitator CzcD-associated flavoprotein CzcO